MALPGSTLIVPVLPVFGAFNDETGARRWLEDPGLPLSALRSREIPRALPSRTEPVGAAGSEPGSSNDSRETCIPAGILGQAGPARVLGAVAFRHSRRGKRLAAGPLANQQLP